REPDTGTLAQPPLRDADPSGGPHGHRTYPRHQGDRFGRDRARHGRCRSSRTAHPLPGRFRSGRDLARRDVPARADARRTASAGCSVPLTGSLKTLLLRGLLAGLIAGLLAATVGHFVGEPHVDAAIALEEAM